MPIEHLLVVSPTEAPVQPVRKGWTPFGHVAISSLPEVACVWIYGRPTSRKPAPATADLAERARELFSGVWTPASEEALYADLMAVFDPCVLDGAEA